MGTRKETEHRPWKPASTVTSEQGLVEHELPKATREDAD